MPARLHEELTLELNADVAEWCPAPGHRRLLAAGTYELDEATGARAGRLYLYRLAGGGACAAAAAAAGPPRLRRLATLELPGVFDLRWHSTAAPPLLAAALADGSVRVLRVGGAGPEAGAEAATTIETVAAHAGAPGRMALSLDWGGGPTPAAAASADLLVAGFCDGGLALLCLRPGSPALLALAEWRGHDGEVWAAAADRRAGHLLYSGADDAAFKLWDARAAAAGGPAAWADRRSHGAGVTCVAAAPHQENIVATGSYDEQARVWDVRASARRVFSARAAAGGGVWRLRWHPADGALLLAAAMHAGFALLRAHGGAGDVAVVERYEHQRTLGYGADWCREEVVVPPESPGGDADGGAAGAGGAEAAACGTSVVATASFYDRLLHVWSPAAAADWGGAGG